MVFDPDESAVIVVVGTAKQGNAPGFQMGDEAFHVLHPVIDHEGLALVAEIFGIGRKNAPLGEQGLSVGCYRLEQMPVIVGRQPERLAVPFIGGGRVGTAEEDTADAGDELFHAFPLGLWR